MKSGYVAIIGRPNSGKSTLLNNLLGHKVSITSPKPQTTRYLVQAVYEEKRGQIIFIDSPGMFTKVEDPVSKITNFVAQHIMNENLDVIIYLVDHTKEKDEENNKILGTLRKIQKPKILAYNKIDIRNPSFLPHYRFIEDEFQKTIHISALFKSNLNYLIDNIFELLPVRKRIIDNHTKPTPLINMDSRMFVAEIIREKAFIFLRKEVPYTITTTVDDIVTRENSDIYIKARIITSNEKYKKMIIGENGRMIKEIGTAARKELETATNKKIYIAIVVEVNPYWYESLK